MAGGSEEAESDDDRQCQHCGLWFAPEGVLPHERNCDLAGFARRLVDLTDPFAVQRADDVSLDEVDHGPEPESPDAVASDAPPSPGDRAGGDPSPVEAVDGVEEVEEVATDGGPKEIPEFGSSEEAESAGASEDVTTCPGCDRPATADEIQTPREVLPDEVVEQHGELKRVDHICVPCSTDDSGNWTSPVEGFNADA